MSEPLTTSAETKDSPSTQNSQGETLVSAPITIDDFHKCEIKIGLILSAERVPETERLVKFSVDCGEETPRTIVSGIATHYPDEQVLVGKRVPVLTNLSPRKMKGIESQGMILYAVGAETLTTLEPGAPVPPGTPVQ